MIRFPSQAATCPPVYLTRWRLHTVPFNAKRQAGNTSFYGLWFAQEAKREQDNFI